MRLGSSSSAPTTAALVAALLVAPQIASKAARDALFLASFDVRSLPLMTATAAVASLVATLLFSRILARTPPARVLPSTLALSLLLFVVEGRLAASLPRAAAVLLYLHYATFGAVLLSSFWSVVTERFDPHAAKRAMGGIGAGASLGGVLGGLIAWRAAGHLSMPALLLALAAATGLGLVGVLAFTRGTTTARAAHPAQSEAPSGLAVVAQVPYLRQLALLVLLGALLEVVLDYLLSASAAARFGKGPTLLSFFAVFHTLTAALALLIQATLTQRLLQGPGIAATLGLQPAVSLGSAGLAFLAPGFPSLLLLRGAHAVLRNSAFRAAYELLYSPLPPEQKRPAKVIVDVACDRLGTLLGSGAVMLVLALAGPAVAARGLLLVAATAAGLALLMTRQFRADYVTALGDSLRAGHVALEPGAPAEPTTLLTLASLRLDTATATGRTDGLSEQIAALRSGDTARVQRVLDRPVLEAPLVPQAILLLGDDVLASLALRALRRVAREQVPALVAALLDERLPAPARRRVPRVLKTVPTQEAVDGLMRALEDGRFDIRYRSGQALRHLRESAGALRFPAPVVFERAACEADELDGSDGRLDHVFTLLALVGDKDALDLARRALAGSDARLRGTALEYLDNVLPPEVRAALFPHVAPREVPALPHRSAVEARAELLRSASALPRPATGDDPDY